MGFAKFMSSWWGRGLRIVAGAGLIAWGLLGIGGIGGAVLATVGAVPFMAGLLDVCLIGRIFLGTPLRGDDVRANLKA